MQLNNISSLQATIKDLKEIVAKNQGDNHESAVLVKQMEAIVEEMEKKAKSGRGQEAVALPPLSTAQVIV